MFTLGNHDGMPGGAARLRLRSELAASALHVGVCDADLDACVHPTLPIATLYSGRLGCHPATHYGCPAPASARWVDDVLESRGASSLALLVTHIPPPNVLGLSVHGAVGESVCCWDEFSGDAAVLPAAAPAIHAFGHDHSNLFVSSPGVEQGHTWCTATPCTFH